jgi:hypothetical protein
MDSAQEKGSTGTSAAPPMGGGDVERATIGNPSLRESESSSKSVAISSKGKVSPLIHPGNPSRRESESVNIPNSTRGNPSKGESESRNNSKSAHGNPSKGESKSTSTSNVGRFKRGGQEDEKPDGKEAEKNEPQQRADPFHFNTPRIPMSVGPVVEELPPAPLTARQMPPQERAYQMPSVPTRQLTKRDLEAYDGKALDAIEAVANSAPYLGDEAYRNALI